MKKTKKLANALIDLIHDTYIATKEHSNGGGLLTQTVITIGNKSLAILKNTNLEVYDNETANHKHFKITKIEEAMAELNNPKPISYDPNGKYS